MLSGNKKWVAAAAAAAGLSLAVGLYLRSRSKARAGAGEAERRPKAPVPAEEAELRARYARDGQGHVFDMLDAGLVRFRVPPYATVLALSLTVAERAGRRR